LSKIKDLVRTTVLKPILWHTIAIEYSSNILIQLEQESYFAYKSLLTSCESAVRYTTLVNNFCIAYLKGKTLCTLVRMVLYQV